MAAQVTLSNLAQTYSGIPIFATAVTVPAGLNVNITYADSTTPPTNVGSYAVVATIMDPAGTGSASGTLVISKANQVITFGTLPAKTYGDAPFAVTATLSSGLPIKWESSDPSVASVSSSALVTLTGAGQTSILASNAGDSNYNAASWIAQPLNVARSLAALPSGTQTVTYDGIAKGMNSNALPSGQATEITYRATSVAEAATNSQVVFQNCPDTFTALNYTSKGFEALNYWAMGKYISLPAGTARKLDYCDVVLSSLARYDTSSPNGFLSWANAHPELVVPPSPGISIPGNSGGFYHPVTLSFYDYASDGITEVYHLLTSQTVQAFIPWRPLKLADGVTDYTLMGYAFRVPFSFPDGIILPEQVWVAVSYNTGSHGTAPIGVPGPYNALNVTNLATTPPEPLFPLTGITQFATGPAPTLYYQNWRWQSTSGTTGPMLRLRAIPTNATLNAPVNAGSYETKTKTTSFGTDGRSISTLTINKAPLQATLTNLSQIRDGTPKPVTVTTTPVGISTSITYAASAVAPSALGFYPVTATSSNPNYIGQVNGTLQIGDSFTSWQTATFSASGLPPEKTTATADPDGDGLSNFLEYASNLNPLAGNSPSPVGIDSSGSTLDFTYRRNLNALDLSYSIQDSTSLADPSSWARVTPLSETTMSDDGSTRVIRASVAKPAAQPSYFLRLKAAR